MPHAVLHTPSHELATILRTVCELTDLSPAVLPVDAPGAARATIVALGSADLFLVACAAITDVAAAVPLITCVPFVVQPRQFPAELGYGRRSSSWRPDGYTSRSCAADNDRQSTDLQRDALVAASGDARPAPRTISPAWPRRVR